MILVLLIAVAIGFVIAIMFQITLTKRVERLEQGVANIDKDLEDAWVIAIPQEIDSEWAWPERENGPPATDLPNLRARRG